MSISSLVMPKRPDSAVIEQINPSSLNYVSTKQPETLTSRSTNYIHTSHDVGEESEQSQFDSDKDDDEIAQKKLSIIQEPLQHQINTSQDVNHANNDYQLVLKNLQNNEGTMSLVKQKVLRDGEASHTTVVRLSHNEQTNSMDLPDPTNSTTDQTDEAPENSDYTSSSESESEADNCGSDYNDESTEGEEEEYHKSSRKSSRLTKKEITFLKKDLNSNQPSSYEAPKIRRISPKKSLSNMKTETSNTDPAYIMRRENFQTKALEEEKYIESINKRYEFANRRIDTMHNDRIKMKYPSDIVNPRGLVNTGVTCYMNSAIQTLFHVPAMAYYLQNVFNDVYRDTLCAKSVTRDIALLHQRVTDPCARKQTFTPRQVIKRLNDINPLMSEWQQEDSHEYFMSLLGRLQEDSVPKGQKLKSSIIHEMFGGTFLQTVECHQCGHKSETHQDFFDIQVSIDKAELKYTNKSTLEGSLRHYFEPSIISKTDTEGYDCEKCKKSTNATTNVRIEHPPEYLVVSVKRYKYSNNAICGSSQKIKNHLQITPQLEMSQFTQDTDEPVRYQLLSFVSHEGRSASSGHYIAHCLQNDGSWAMYDDDFVKTIGNTGDTLKSKLDVYFMVYSRLKPILKAPAFSHEDQISSDIYDTSDEKPLEYPGHFENVLSSGPLYIQQLSPSSDDSIKVSKPESLLPLDNQLKDPLEPNTPESMEKANNDKNQEQFINNTNEPLVHVEIARDNSDDDEKKAYRSSPSLQRYGSQKKRKVSKNDYIDVIEDKSSDTI